MKKSVLPVLFVFSLCVSLLSADVPVREEQLLYSVTAFNGRDYSRTFSAENSDTIYLLAEEDNFMTVSKTLVYFWPITGEWKTDTQVLNIPFGGTLEIWQGNDKVTESELTNYVMYSKDNEYELSWSIKIAEEARSVNNEYLEDVSAYLEDMKEYEYKKAIVEAAKRQLADQIMQLRDQGKEVDLFLDELNKLSYGDPPKPPGTYAIPPSEMFYGHHINLPAGDYQIQFRDLNGLIMEGSEKTILVREKIGTGSVGYEIIPGDKWTRSVTSNTPSEVLYVDGSTDLYLQCFYQDRYNDLFHQKILNNNGKGSPGISRWIRTHQIPGITLEAKYDRDGPLEIEEEPFVVEQTSGGTLGYAIVPFEPEGEHKDKKPNIIAFHVSLGPGIRSVSLKAQDADGAYVQDGAREIRIVGEGRLGILLLLITLVPFVVMWLAFIRRRKNITD